MNMHRSLLRAKIAESKPVPGAETAVRIEEGRPPFVGGEGSRAVAASAQAIYGEMGRTLEVLPITGGGTDPAMPRRTTRPWWSRASASPVSVTVTDSIVPRLYLMTRLMMELAKK